MPDKNTTAGPIEMDLMRVYDHQNPNYSLPRVIEIIARHLDAVSARLDAIERPHDGLDVRIGQLEKRRQGGGPDR